MNTNLAHAAWAHTQSLTKKVTHTRIGRHRITAATTLLMLVWLRTILGPGLPFLLIMLGTGIGGIWLLRHRKDIAASIAIITAAAGIPAAITIVMAAHNSPNVITAAAVLTGYILIAPLPTLTAWALRPALTSRPLSSLVGSLILVLTMTPIVVFGDHGYGTQLLVASATLSCGLIWTRHRRALHHHLRDLPRTTAGWTDLGPRVLPTGGQIHRVLIRRGYAVAATLTTAKTISPGALHRALSHAIDLAAAAGIPATRVRPVLLAPAATSGLGPHKVNAHGAAATVLVLTPEHLEDVTALAPRSFLRRRRPLLTAATLAQPKGRAA